LFAGGDKFDENEIVNFPVQALAALTQQRLEVLISRRLGFPTAYDNAPILPLVNIYDSIKFDVRSPEHEQELDEVVEDAHKELTTTDIWGMLQDRFGRSVPLVIEKEH